jgi:hypothetical protein
MVCAANTTPHPLPKTPPIYIDNIEIIYKENIREE